MDDSRIIVELQSILQTTGGGGTQQPGGTPIPSGAHRTLNQGSSSNAFMAGISAQLMVSSVSRIISAFGNTELASGIQQGAEWAFLLGRAAAMDPTAIVTAMFKGLAELIKLIKGDIEKKKEIAKSYNELDVIKMMSGQLTIGYNTEISYSKYGRLKLTEKK